jgi:hypothetical protein
MVPGRKILDDGLSKLGQSGLAGLLCLPHARGVDVFDLEKALDAVQVRRPVASSILPPH